MTEPATERLITPRFVAIAGSALFYFIAFAMLLPTLPRYLETELGASGTEVGIVVGSFGVSAALVRPFLGRLGDRHGRRILLVAGVALSGVTVLLYPLWASIGVLLGLRLITGIGEAGAFVGAATATQDLAPDDRRGEAASYFSLSVYLGLGIGPFLGELIDGHHGFTGVTRMSFAFALVSTLLGFSIPGRPPEPVAAPTGVRPAFLHRAAVLPGVFLTLSLIGFTGYTTFLALYLDDLSDGSASAGTVFLVYSAVVVVFRLSFANLPDRLGAKTGSTIAFALIGTGLLIVSLWPSVVGVYVGTVVLALGVAFNYPALFLFVMAGTPASERSHSVASFGFFFDIAGVIGAPLLGLVIDLTGSERPAFAVGAAAAFIGLIGLRFLRVPPAPRPVEAPT